MSDAMVVLVPVGCDLTRAAAKENSRYAITGVLVDGPKGRFVATDGRVLAVVPFGPRYSEAGGAAETDDENPLNGDAVTAIVPVECMKAARRKGGRDRAVTLAVRPDGATVESPGKCSMGFPLIEGSFPNPDDILATVDGPPHDGGTLVSFGVNVKLLANLAAALGTEAVRLTVCRDADGVVNVKRPIGVKPLGTWNGNGVSAPNAAGVIMPVSLC